MIAACCKHEAACAGVAGAQGLGSSHGLGPLLLRACSCVLLQEAGHFDFQVVFNQTANFTSPFEFTVFGKALRALQCARVCVTALDPMDMQARQRRCRQ